MCPLLLIRIGSKSFSPPHTQRRRYTEGWITGTVLELANHRTPNCFSENKRRRKRKARYCTFLLPSESRSGPRVYFHGLKAHSHFAARLSNNHKERDYFQETLSPSYRP